MFPFAGEEDTPGTEGKTDVMFASLTLSGESKKFYRFQTPDDGVVDYYDEAGKSAKKFLVRKPVSDGIMRSAQAGHEISLTAEGVHIPLASPLQEA